MSNAISFSEDADFVQEAKKNGSRILAMWKDDPVWHSVEWATPKGCAPHWGIEGQWTPGADPIYFLPSPPIPMIDAAMVEPDWQKARRLGRKAYEDGKDYKNNPFTGKTLRAIWLGHYMEAQAKGL